MTSASEPDLNPSPTSSIYLQPKYFADHLSPQQDYCLFLDIDGTLADFTLNPKDSFIPDSTLALLQEIQSHGVKIAIVTGRSLTEAKQMLSPLQVPIAATHGLEIDFGDRGDYYFDNDEGHTEISIAQVDTNDLVVIKQAINQSCVPYDDFTIEDKPYSVALHYRQNPALADVAYTIVSESIKKYPNWVLKQGKYVWEVIPKGVNKGTAILILLKKMQTSTEHNAELYSIFIGDDLTDEAGFMVVQGEGNTAKRCIENQHRPVKGMGIKVGREPTCAHYYVYTIYEVTVLLKSLLIFYEQLTSATSELTDANPPLPKP